MNDKPHTPAAPHVDGSTHGPLNPAVVANADKAPAKVDSQIVHDGSAQHGKGQQAHGAGAAALDAKHNTLSVNTAEVKGSTVNKTGDVNVNVTLQHDAQKLNNKENDLGHSLDQAVSLLQEAKLKLNDVKKETIKVEEKAGITPPSVDQAPAMTTHNTFVCAPQHANVLNTGHNDKLAVAMPTAVVDKAHVTKAPHSVEHGSRA